MKTTKIIRDKNEVMKNLLTNMYESVCAQKEMLEILLEEYETEEDNQSRQENNPRELIKGVSGLAEFLACGSTRHKTLFTPASCRNETSPIVQETDGGSTRHYCQDCWSKNQRYSMEFPL